MRRRKLVVRSRRNPRVTVELCLVGVLAALIIIAILLFILLLLTF